MSKSGIGFAGGLTILFIALRIFDVISWHWLWLISPLWVTGILWIVFLVSITKLFK